jgi:hypothetical protein
VRDGAGHTICSPAAGLAETLAETVRYGLSETNGSVRARDQGRGAVCSQQTGATMVFDLASATNRVAV